MKILGRLRLVPALTLAVLLAACGAPTVDVPDTIGSIAAEDEQFSTLVAALTEAGLVDTFSDPDAGPFTVFAPTNAAFTQFLTDAGLTAEELLANPDLGDILSYHVLEGEFLAADVIAAAPFSPETLLAGAAIDVDVVAGDVLLNCRVNVVQTDIEAANGVIHVIDYVLDPNAADLTIAEIAACDDAFSTLVAALSEAELVDTFADPAAGPFTVFAPTNDAFTQFLTDADLTAEELLANPDLGDILSYHVLQGEVVAADFVEKAPSSTPTLLAGSDIDFAVVGGGVLLNCRVNVVATDIQAANGVIHVVDYVLDPNAADLTIAQIAACDDQFSILVSALTAADLVDTFADPDAGPFTVFAPTNAAIELYLSFKDDFEVDDFLAQDPDLIAAFLKYHVHGGLLTAADLVDLAAEVDNTFSTLQGPAVSVGLDADAVVLNPGSSFAATVVDADIAAANGLIHVIDIAIEAPIQ